MTVFKPNRRFRREYNRLFRRDPLAANLKLLLHELANENGEVRLGPNHERELAELMAMRFTDCRAYQLSEGVKR